MEAARPGRHPRRREADTHARPSGFYRAARHGHLLPRLSGEVVVVNISKQNAVDFPSPAGLKS